MEGNCEFLGCVYNSTVGEGHCNAPDMADMERIRCPHVAHCPSCAEKDLLISRYAEELTRLMDVVGEYDCEVIDELLNGKGK